MLYLSESDVAALLSPDEARASLRAMFTALAAGLLTHVPRRRVSGSARHLCMMSASWMDAEHDLMAAKLYTGGGGGNGTYHLLLWDGRTGALLAMIEADTLGQLRTGATTALATDLMSRPDATRLLVIGSGHQAVGQVVAIARVRPLAQVLVHSRHPGHREACARTITARTGVPTRALEDPGPAAHEAHIIVTATNATEPVLLGEWLGPGVHINAIGSNHAARRETDDALVARSDRIVVDDLDAAHLEAGDLILADPAPWDRVIPLADVVAGRRRARPDAAARTLFVSQGIAAEDLAMGHVLLEKARHMGVGQELALPRSQPWISIEHRLDASGD